MNMIKKYKKTFILVLVFLVLLSFYFIRYFLASREIYTESYLRGEEYIMNPKTYGINEYSPVNISDEQMANIYLNDFKYNFLNDVNYAYQLLNENYRNKKFGSINNFASYINGLNYNNITVDRYSVSSDNKFITVYTKDNNKYIFKVISVMEYEVYLDDYTVEIR